MFKQTYSLKIFRCRQLTRSHLNSECGSELLNLLVRMRRTSNTSRMVPLISQGSHNLGAHACIRNPPSTTLKIPTVILRSRPPKGQRVVSESLLADPAIFVLLNTLVTSCTINTRAFVVRISHLAEKYWLLMKRDMLPSL